jgi:hypothetical protein
MIANCAIWALTQQGADTEYFGDQMSQHIFPSARHKNIQTIKQWQGICYSFTPITAALN